MKPKHYIFLALLVCIILLSFLLGRSCERTTYPEIISSDTVTVTNTVYIPNTDTNFAYIPVPYKVTIPDTVPVLDSTSCFNLSKQYYSTTEYRDTIINDSTLFFVLHENISENKIVFRSVDYKTFDKVITETITITNVIPPKHKIQSFTFMSVGKNLSNNKHTLVVDNVLYYNRIGIIGGFDFDGSVKIGVGIKW